MRAALAHALAGRAALVFAEDAGAVATLRTAPRDSGVLLLVIGDAVASLDRAMLLAAIGPLAVACAPVRLAALDVATGAEPEDVVAAALFLAGAASSTGQVLRITTRG